MAIQIIDGFQVNTALPIDNRIVASGSSARNAIPYKYHGLRVYDISDNIPYVWNGSSWLSENASGIAGAGTAEYIPLYTSSNVISNSLLYQYNGIIKTADNGNGSDLVQIDPEYGSVYAQGGLYGPGSAITNINASNISTGALALNRLTNGSTGWILTGGVTSPAYVSPTQVSVGTASVSSNATITQTTTNATHYLTFVSSGAWTSTAGNSTIRANASGISYNPFTNILTTGRINYSGGALASATASRITFANLTSTAASNVTNLEFNNVRNTIGTDWLTSGYRIQAKVDDQYLAYIQFNGTNNDSGISIGTGYQSTDSTSNANERFRISAFGDTVINSANPYTSDTLNVTNTSGSGVARMSIQANQPIITLRNAVGTEKWSIYRKSTDDNLTFYNGSVDKLVLQSGGTLRAAADNSSALGTTSFRFTQVCAVNGTIQTSDLREKKDIQSSNLGLEFITKLKPVSYKWKVGENIVTAEEDGVSENGELKYKQVITPREGKRTHYGLIAQEVKDVLGDIDFGGFIHDSESDLMGLRYDQFISPLIKAIQEQQAQIEELKSKIN
jgi:hypothetical protein